MATQNNKSENRFLTKEEELALGYDILAYREDKENKEKEKKAIEAVHKLFHANEYYAVNRALYFLKTTQVPHYDQEDATIDAKIGLLRGIWNYDPRRNTKITTVASMPIYKELVYRCNIDETKLVMKASHLIYGKAKREWKQAGSPGNFYDYLKEHKDRYKGIHEHVADIENVLQGISSLEYSMDDGDGALTELKNIIPDNNYNYDFDKFVYREKTVFSEETDTIIKRHLTELEQEVVFYEYDDCNENKPSFQEFLTKHNIIERQYNHLLRKGMKKIKEVMETNKNKIAIIGSGITGATIARELAEKGNKVVVFESRNHVGGNLYDYVDKETGCLVHKYGPHIFHTSNEEVWNWANRFATFSPFQLRNRAYIKEIDKWLKTPFGTHTARELLSEKEYFELLDFYDKAYPDKKFVPITTLLKSSNKVASKFGKLLWDYNYKLYTSKQWGISPEEVDPEVLKRVPVYLSDYDRYFVDTYEGLPDGGYTKWINNILDHPNIEVKLNTKPELTLKRKTMLVNNEEYYKVFYTGPVDELFNYQKGELQYRSLKFDFFVDDMPDNPKFGDPCVDVYPDHSFDFTRITHYGLLPLQKDLKKQISAKEYSYKYDKNDPTLEPYYPISTKEDKSIYNKYKNKVDRITNLQVAGRLGNYKYYNMDQAIESAFVAVQDFIKNEPK